jgi:dUTP pyrophosphatase
MTYFNAVHPMAVIPARATIYAAGYDLTAVDMKRDRQYNVIVYDTGIVLDIPKNMYGDVRPRSSIYKQGNFVLANSCGVVDSDYKGTIKLIFRPVSDEVSIEDDKPYNIGDRIGQIIFTKYYTVPDDKKPTKVRGSGGHGSTGT